MLSNYKGLIKREKIQWEKRISIEKTIKKLKNNDMQKKIKTDISFKNK